MPVNGVGWSDYTIGVGSAPRQEKPAADPNDALASKDTFLKLLVAQIRHQDPLAPQDGIQFLSQLAEFSGLEQSMNMRKELESIRATVEQIQAGAAGKATQDED